MRQKSDGETLACIYYLIDKLLNLLPVRIKTLLSFRFFITVSPHEPKANHAKKTKNK